MIITINFPWLYLNLIPLFFNLTAPPVAPPSYADATAPPVEEK